MRRTRKAAAVLGLTLAISPFSAWSKGEAPKNAACDAADKSFPAWTACAGDDVRSLDQAQLFYVGYWLIRQERYREALAYLNAAKKPDERILTYLGFATRKLGDVDSSLPFYERALALNPDYLVARAYLGEALLALRRVAQAKEQLIEISKRCNEDCAEYRELATALAAHRG